METTLYCDTCDKTFDEDEITNEEADYQLCPICGDNLVIIDDEGTIQNAD